MLSPFILYPALRTILVNRIQKILHSYEKVRYSSESTSSGTSSVESPQQEKPGIADIPLNRIQNDNEIQYVSALAFRLAKLWQKPALEIANQVVAELQQLDCSAHSDLEVSLPPSYQALLQRVEPAWVIQITSPGWINLRLTEPGLLEWMEFTQAHIPQYPHSISVNMQTYEAKDLSNSTRVFEVLYSHARCCSLLRLGEREGLIQLQRVDVLSATSQYIVEPHSLFRSCTAKRLGWGASAWQLIGQIVDTLDVLTAGERFLSRGEFWKLAFQLSQQFQRFDASQAILGTVKPLCPSIAPSHLGLVLITQALLRLLLEEGCGVTAPSEL